ncbi:MAG: prepilin peptidase [bacterium]
MPIGLENEAIYLYMSVMVFVLGACIGSFLNVCIYRIPQGESIVTPRSHCTHCLKTIAWYDNIPMLSFVILRGQCRHCGERFSGRYAFVEVLTACLFFLVWLKLGMEPRPLGIVATMTPWVVPIYWLCVFGLALGTFVDFDHMIIPDRVTIGGTILGIVFSALVPELHDVPVFLQGLPGFASGIIMSLAGAALGWGLLRSVARIGELVFKREAMGMGDVKLLAAIGAFLGWRAVLFNIIISSLLGAAVGLSLVVLGKKEMKSGIPYGPYIAIAAVLWILWGPTAWSWYINLFAIDLIGPEL